MEIIEIGKTTTEVRITHMKRSVLYFVTNIFPKEIKIQRWQERLLKKLGKDNNGDNRN